MYVDVILPLPLEGEFTYSLSQSQLDKLSLIYGEKVNMYIANSSTTFLGFRVLVPFARGKNLTALAIRLHDNKPNFKTREIIDILDNTPILLEEQYKLWSWISNYYISPLGDIYKAALPSGLKSEDGYRPKTEVYITLDEKYCNETAIKIALNTLLRAKAQYTAFRHYLVLSGIVESNTIDVIKYLKPLYEITREELLNVSGCSLAIIRALQDRGILRLYDKEVARLPYSNLAGNTPLKQLNQAQEDAKKTILFQFEQKDVVLLHGVTSSGKTEIYIHLIQRTLEQNKQVLYLLPEIALTIQIMSRLKSVFGSRLGIYHSRYSDAERVEIWQKQLSDEPYDIILGARSAVFLPFQRLGLVIIDEEHENSYKQQDPSPRYHARSVAMMLARNSRAKVLLGTATPSVESLYNAKSGKYGFVPLYTRYKNIELPIIELVDIKDLKRRKIMHGLFSPQLLSAMREALERDEQIILFQNRRGFAPMIECHDCGWVPRCENCDVTLTYHKRLGQLTCHYCGYTYTVPSTCPSCEGHDLKERGYGTEKIEDEIKNIFPAAKVARMDLDTTRTKGAYERIIDDFSNKRTNILIGTQMVSKGLDFDKVSVVGILSVDGMLNYPDFRSYEQTYSMCCQVSGRAGRKGQQGRVFLQTMNADLPIISQIVSFSNDIKVISKDNKTIPLNSFYQEILEERKTFHYPPFFRLIYVYLRHSRNDVVERAAVELGGRLRAVFSDRVLGPDKPVVARVKTQHIRKIVLKFETSLNTMKIREHLRYIERQLLTNKAYSSLILYFDIDPM